MDDFFKSLRQNLESRENPQFNRGAWKRMQQKMQNAGDSNSSANKSWLYYLLGLLLLTSLGANYYLYQKLPDENDSTPDNTTLSEHLTDTIYRERIIHQTDTIYKIKNVYSKDSRSTGLQDIPSSGPRHIVPYLDLIDEFILDGPTGIPSSGRSLDGEYKKDVRKDVVSLRILPIQVLKQDLRSGIDLVPSIPVHLDKLHPDSVNSVQKADIQMKGSDPVTSREFLIGIHGGPNIVADSKIESSIGAQVGLQALWGLRERWRLSAAVDYNQISFETEFPEGFPDIPVVTSPSDDYKLDEIDVEGQGSLHFGLGVQYLFDIEDKLHPFVGLGWNLARVINDKQVYEFTNPARMDDIEIVAPKNHHPGIYHYLLGQIGMEYDFLPLWHLQVCASYRHRLRGDQNLKAISLTGLRLGILNNF